MASKGFVEQTKKVFKGTCPSPMRYWKFLDASEDADNIYHFCMKLFQALISSSKDQFLDDDHQAMYSTLMILQFYKNTKLKSQKWLEQTEKIFQDNKPKLFEHARWIVKLYLKNAEDNQFAVNFISSICHIQEKFSWEVEPGQRIEEALMEAQEYYDIIELKRRDKPYKKLAQFSFDSIIGESRIGAFSYCCFLDYLRSTNYQPKKKIWLHIMDTLKGMIHALRFTTKSYELVTVFLHFTCTVIKFHGCVYDEVLKEMIYLVNLLRSSPGHNAHLAQEVFEVMHNELKSPGYSFRKEIKRRFVNVDLKKVDKLGSKKYYLTYRNVSYEHPEFCSINNLRKLIIYNVLGSFKLQNISKYWSIVEPLDTDTTYDLYYKIMSIIDITFNLQTYENISKLVRENIIELFKLGWKPYRKLKKQQESELAELLISEHTQKIFQFPNFQIVKIKDPRDLIKENHQHSLNQLFQEIKQYPYNQFFFSLLLEFVFLGNDEELATILQLICDYLINQVSPNDYQKLAFYLIPIREGQCSLAEYISNKDIWYRRHVFNVFRERLLFPNVSLEDPEIKDSFPSYLYTKSFHMYLREAQRKIPFQVFQCDLSLEDINGKQQSRTIYFVSNILMGWSMQAAISKNQAKRQKKNSYPDGLQIYLQKVKKVSPIGVDITVRYKQPGTDILVTKQQKFMIIQDLQICNAPRPYFFGYKPNPLTQFIQLSMLTQNANKVFRSELESRQNFKRHSDPQIFQAFRDLFINMTADSIVIERSDGMKDTMKIMIDGVEYKDVDKFKVTPAYTKHKLPLTFPVRCFLPFES